MNTNDGNDNPAAPLLDPDYGPGDPTAINYDMSMGEAEAAEDRKHVPQGADLMQDDQGWKEKAEATYKAQRLLKRLRRM